MINLWSAALAKCQRQLQLRCAQDEAGCRTTRGDVGLTPRWEAGVRGLGGLSCLEPWDGLTAESCHLLFALGLGTVAGGRTPCHLL